MVSSINSPNAKSTRMMNLKSQIRGLSHQRSVLANRVATDLGFTGDFIMENLPWNDPRVSVSDRVRFQSLNKRIKELVFELDKLENPNNADAKRIVFGLINRMSLEESIMFLHKYDCSSTLELVDKLTVNPHLLDGEVDFL